MHVETGPERDEDRGEVLDDERDPDVEAADADEVEELDEREAEDSEDGEKAQLPPVRAQRRRAQERHRRHQDHRGAGCPHLGQAKGGKPRGVEDDLRDDSVQRPEDDRGPHERVAECRARDRPLRLEGGRRKGCVGHGRGR